MKTFSVESRIHSEFIDITGEVEKAVRESGIRQGICVVFTPHTTAAITINENADPDVVTDIIGFLKEAIPHESRYLHGEGKFRRPYQIQPDGLFNPTDRGRWKAGIGNLAGDLLLRV